MVTILERILLIIILLLILLGPTVAKEFYSFPVVPAAENRDIILARRPAAPGFGNNTGTKNFTVGTLLAPFSDYTGPLYRRLATQQNLSSYARLHQPATFAGLLAARLDVNGPGYFSGNVGIRTQTPGDLFSVGNASIPHQDGFDGIDIVNTGYNSILKVGQDPTHQLQYVWYYNGAPASAWAHLTTYDYNNPLRIDGSSLVLQMHGGNVGIRTTTPDRTLDVVGDIRASNSISTIGTGGATGEQGTTITGANIDMGGTLTAYGTVIGANVRADLWSGTLSAKNLSDGIESATIASLLAHPAAGGNPHQTTAAQIFGSHTGVRYPLFNPDNTYEWKRPLEVCVDVFDGRPGERGFRGYSGAPGSAATVAVGTVTTGNPGTAAIVTNSGTFDAAVLNFTIPRGLDGDINNLTQAQFETKLAEPGGKLLKRAITTNTEVLFEAQRVNGSSGWFITGDGLIVVQDNAGTRLLSFDPATKRLQVKRSNGAVIFDLSSTGKLTL